MLIDFSPPPGAAECAALERRLRRLVDQGMVESARQAHATLIGVASTANLAELRIRSGFAYRTDPAPPPASDRGAPSPFERPPATRLVQGRSIALRFYLTTLAYAQMTVAPGTRPGNVLTIAGRDGWADLVAGRLKPRGPRRPGATYETDRDDRVRSIRTALNKLEDAGLVALPQKHRPKNRYDGFELQREDAAEQDAPYTVPRPGEASTVLPGEFVTKKWIHLLEDSEIALLLLVACGYGQLPGEKPGHVAIPAETRLLHYGISRDAYEAHRMLERFGLIRVHEVGRHGDGRAIDFAEEGAHVHRLELLPAGFGSPADEVVPAEIRSRLGRR